MPVRVSARSGLAVIVFNPSKSAVDLKELITYNLHELYGLHDPGFDSRHRQDIFCSLKRPDWLWDPSSLLLNGYRLHFLAVKQRGREVGHSSPYGTGVKSTYVHTYVRTYLCMYVCMYVCVTTGI